MIAFYLTNMISGGSLAGASTAQAYHQPTLSIGIGIRLCLAIGLVLLAEQFAGVFMYPLKYENNNGQRVTIATGEK
jgi:hypothetical protein